MLVIYSIWPYDKKDNFLCPYQTIQAQLPTSTQHGLTVNGSSPKIKSNLIRRHIWEMQYDNASPCGTISSWYCCQVWRQPKYIIMIKDWQGLTTSYQLLTHLSTNCVLTNVLCVCIKVVLKMRYIGTVLYVYLFIHHRPWIWPWIKSISNELDIITHAIASQLSGDGDVISNRLWCNQQNVHQARVDNVFLSSWSRYVV